MYQSVSPNVNFVEQEKKIEAFWEEEHIFEKSIDSRKKGTPYVFYDGPPTANGKPHIGHVLTRVIKDMIPRYRTMKGYMVPRKAGWDTHGLPVELEVEKKLGLDGSNFSTCLTVSKAFAEAMAAEKASVSALIHPTEERAQVSAAQAIPAPMNREQRRAAVKAHPAVVDFRAQEAAKAARRAQLKAELEALDNA